MAYIYCADVWCDDCGDAIKQRLTAEGKAPAFPIDERSYDSDDFPKRIGDDEESDTPTHCAAEENCINAIEIEGGKVGFLFGDLTHEGITYINDSIEDTNEDNGAWCQAVTGLWYQHYTDEGYQFENKPNWI